jgi:hypothetical protein
MGMNAEIGPRGKIMSRSAIDAAIGAEVTLIVVYPHSLGQIR